MLKVGLIGCGKIADDHLQQIRRVAGAQVIAVCDLEILMARQLAERFGIQGVFSSVGEMLAACHPDVVHITSPPQTHFVLATQCLEAGCHVYVEKPFTLTAADAEKLVTLARNRSMKITAGHDLQFSPAAVRMRELVKSGYLGGRPLHLESYYCYDLTDPRYAKALLGDRKHWIRHLPGKLLQNVISHGIARIAEFVSSDSPNVMAKGFVSPVLESLGETEIVDELRVVIDDDEVTAYFTFSSQMRPALNALRLYGSRNGLEVNQDFDTVIKLPGKALPSYANKFVPPFRLALQQFGNLTKNMRRFLSNDFHMKSGMKHLIELFYESITQNSEPPIPPREIVLTAKIMDSIFTQLDAQRAESAFNAPPILPVPQPAPAITIR
jgi:predicted dehydrogenase